ncbi:nucleotidyl transferase AbiEii/AbiGii toxin family protein [Candidatus Roizmanbacteria bacterium]|nr:nucleotidyl transferase AbiEii/AbiGii toxin family protein [Candidatus Roizmanbacteria bacterium]
MKIYRETIPFQTGHVLEKIQSLSELNKFYLTGGTALSLLLGHRESEDLDFFTRESFQPELLQQKLTMFGALTSVEISEGTLNAFLSNVKLQFLHYPYELLEELLQWDNIYIASSLDIACTKLVTISMRGSKKDFIDLYFLLKQFSLPFLFEKLDEKYRNVQYNKPHILKSLVYFEDAEQQPTPRMHIPVEWNEVKKTITEAATTFPL